jgi:hypothetical protein
MLIVDIEQTEDLPTLGEILQALRSRAARFWARLRRQPASQPEAAVETAERDRTTGRIL